MRFKIIVPNLEDLKDLNIHQEKLEFQSINRQTGECIVESNYDKHLNQWERSLDEHIARSERICTLCKLPVTEHDKTVLGVALGCRGFYFGTDRTQK